MKSYSRLPSNTNSRPIPIPTTTMALNPFRGSLTPPNARSMVGAIILNFGAGSTQPVNTENLNPNPNISEADKEKEEEKKSRRRKNRRTKGGGGIGGLGD